MILVSILCAAIKIAITTIQLAQIYVSYEFWRAVEDIPLNVDSYVLALFWKCEIR